MNSQKNWIAFVTVLMMIWLALFYFGIQKNLLTFPQRAHKSFESVFVQGGCFKMGSSSGYFNNGPVHRVCVNDFWMSKYDVTVGEFREFVKTTGYKTDAEGNNGCFVSQKYGLRRKDATVSWRSPGFDQTERDPVVCISWKDANRYIDWKGKQTGSAMRLPTEAEWEYAARDGVNGEKWAGTSQESDLREYAWYESNSSGRTHPVGEKKPNRLGLYDMTGNIWQWCSDWFSADYYQNSPQDNPKGPAAGFFRVSRGGDWDNVPQNIQTTVRWEYSGGEGDNRIGFRVVH